MCCGVRLENWVYGLWMVSDNPNRSLRRVPRVTMIQLSKVTHLTECWLDENWPAGLANSAEIWKNSCQQPAVIQAIYQILLEADENKLIGPIKQIADNGMEPRWFVKGGQGTFIELWRTHVHVLQSLPVSAKQKRLNSWQKKAISEQKTQTVRTLFPPENAVDKLLMVIEYIDNRLVP
ncbi:MAG: hypothetical protein UZ22_OP11002000361 [Microgenomates bacterium OLB23]|nr:MAG: hypothetical protein UZ22_OP11002000361 [Microgenomates bacterium OLB23]